MNKLKNYGLLCLLLLVSAVAKAQDVTALWDFVNMNPASLKDVSFEGTSGEVASTVEGISFFVDATNGKLKARDSDAQFNAGTIIRIPVKSAKDTVTVEGYPGYSEYTVHGEDWKDTQVFRATTSDVAQGYVEIVSKGGYLRSLKVVQVSPLQEKQLYVTDFSDWTKMSASKQETVVAQKTKYSGEQLDITLFDTAVDPAGQNDKFNNGEPLGWLQAAKSDDPYILTSPLSSITTVRFVHAATGGNRGWKLEAKGDGDADWVVISETVANPAGWCEVNAEVNRTNVQLRFTNLNASQNAYMFQLEIRGMVDMSTAPVLGSFVVNGKKYDAADIFDQDNDGVNVATVEVSKLEPMISESNPLTDIVADNGEVTSVSYETTGEGTAMQTVVSILVEANGEQALYRATVVFKPDFTLTYVDSRFDGDALVGTQAVEKDAAITQFPFGADDLFVKPGENEVFRGWFTKTKGSKNRKYTTDDIVTGPMQLYSLVTDDETKVGGRRMFQLNDPYFYDEDHEAFRSIGAGSFHDNQHGWVFGATDQVELYVNGNAYIILGLCRYSAEGDITLTDASGNIVGQTAAKVATDGQTAAISYEGAPGYLRLNFPGTTYLHSIVINNLSVMPFAKNELGWYIVNAGDNAVENGNTLLSTLDIVNGLEGTDRVVVFLPNGTYDFGDRTLTPISRNNLSLIGQSMDGVTIVNEPLEEGIGVTATLLNTSSNLYMQDLTLKNALDYFNSSAAGRAVCLQDKGQHTICKNVRMLSYQDTYYSNAASQFYWETSDIHGVVDFVCGDGDVFYNHCLFTLESRSRTPKSGSVTIAAPNTSASCKYGYVMSHCTIDNLANSFNFGRSWGGNSSLVYLNTTLLQPKEIASTRFTTAGMNVVAYNFKEYRSVDAEGNVVSPESNVLTFTKDKNSVTYETILTADEAEQYTIDKVFTSWRPETMTVQAWAGDVKVEGQTVSWNATDDATAFAVFADERIVGMTTERSFTLPADVTGNISVRAANAMGGLGNEADPTGIELTELQESQVVDTAFYNTAGQRVSGSADGILIRVQTLRNGQRITTKLMK